MISHKHKCIFIHIPKTAGTSIEKKLGHFDGLRPGIQDHRTLRELEPLSSYGLRLTKHDNHFVSVNGIKKRIIRRQQFRGQWLTKQEYDDYFKFAFVRNPWSRVYSWYENVRRDVGHQKTLRISANCSFKRFVCDHLDQFAMRPQLFWLVDRHGKLSMDFVGHFENLQQDFVRVCERLRIDDPTLPVLLKSNSDSYTQHYDAEMISLVASRYKEEIVLFGFKYGE